MEIGRKIEGKSTGAVGIIEKAQFYFVATTCHIWHIKCMKFERLLTLVGEQPFFITGMLLAGDVDPADVQSQLSCWMRSGRNRQLWLGLYIFVSPFKIVFNMQKDVVQIMIYSIHIK